MTDRHSGYVIVLDQDIREDDAEQLVQLFKNIKGVVKVAPVKSDASLQIAKERAVYELSEKLWKVLHP
jgi:hypothetical protein